MKESHDEMERDSEAEEKREGERERETFVSEFERRRNVSYVTYRRCMVYTVAKVRTRLAYRLSRNQSGVVHG